MRAARMSITHITAATLKSTCGTRVAAAATAAFHGASSVLAVHPSRPHRLTGALLRPVSSCHFSSAASSTATSSAAAAAHVHAHAAPSGAGGSSPRGRSFIEIAKREGAASLIGPFPTAGAFDSCLDGLQITRMDSSGEVEGWMTVGRAVENSYGTLHGGAIATLVDVMGTLALLAKDHTRGGVSVEMSTSYLVAVKAGDRVVCKARVLKLGRTLGFTQVDLYTHDGKLAATGRHTKAM